MPTPFDRRHRRLWVAGLFLLLAFGLLGHSAEPKSAESEPAKRVLLLYSDERLLPAGIAADESIRRTFADEMSEPVEFYSEFLDRTRFPTKEHVELQRDFFREKYRGRSPDLIIAAGSGALNFLVEGRSSLFAKVPIVHCAIPKRKVSESMPAANISGIPVELFPNDCLDLALKVQPDIREIVVVAGQAELDRSSVAALRRSAPAYEPQIRFTWLTDHSLEEVRDAVSRLPKHSAVLYLTMFEDTTGRTFTPREALKFFAPASSAPIYGEHNTYLGHGIVGGSMVTYEEIGRKAARVAIRILSGSSPREAAKSESHVAVPMFDWQQLQNWGIDKNLLPPGSIILFQEPSMWDSHRKEILSGAGLCAAETILIGLLILQLQRRKRAETSLRESEQRMSVAVEGANFGIWVRDLTNEEIWATAKWRELFGFPPAGELTIEEVFNHIHPHDRKATIEAFESARDHCGSYDLEFRVLVADKAPRWIASKGHFEADAQGKAFRSMGVSRDFTDRKVAEDTALDLGGRLIHAQEDVQRRLARELHDDLSQSLALLSVELEMYGQSASSTPTDLAARMEGFSAQAKEVSSELHRLSHSLHPAKLDQLGLETALRGFCREFASAHQVGVTFEAHDIPRSLPDEVALCLYRIAQEALQNVIKHSGATKAELTFLCKGSELILTIKDNGTGFDPASGQSGGSLGLVGMGERARFVGGRLDIESLPDGGTRVEVSVPSVQRAELNGSQPTESRELEVDTQL